MYCRNCGKKAEKADIFCTECGNRIRKDKKIPLINLKEMPKKYKKGLFSLLTILIILLLYIGLNNYAFSEEAVIKRYIRAYVNNDYQTIINLSGLEEIKFINNDSIKEKYKDKKNDKIIIKNITENVNKNEHTRTVSYIIDKTTKSTNVTIKRKGRKYLIFKNYVITSTDLLAENVLFMTPKNSQLTVDNIKLDSKYINENNENVVTYKIPKLLKKNTKISLKLANGLELEDIKSVFNNEEVDYRELTYNLVKNDKSIDLEKNLKKALTKVVESALNDEYDKMKDNSLFVSSLFNNSLFIENYNKLKEKYQNSIKNFDISNIDIKNVKLDSENNIIIRSKIEYSYENSENKNYQTSRDISISLNDKLLINDIQLNTLLYMFK